MKPFLNSLFEPGGMAIIGVTLIMLGLIWALYNREKQKKIFNFN